jgi:hypothetical protein
MKKKRRTIAQIADDLAAALKRELADVVAIGGLLLEAREAVDYGDWRAWLATNFGSSSKTADNYMSAASFAATCETVSQLKLRPTALYLLGGHLDDGPDDLFSPEAIKAVLKVAETEWVNAERANSIAESLIPPPEIDDEEAERASEAEERALEKEQRRKIEDILDGPPPELPPSEPSPLPNVSLGQFDKAMAMLTQVHTKPLASFVGTTFSQDRITGIAAFLNAVADAIAIAAVEAAISDVGGDVSKVTPEQVFDHVDCSYCNR